MENYKGKKDCFAYRTRRCMALTEMLCKTRKCPFYMLHMPSPTPTAEVAENFAITAAAPKAAAEAPSKYRLLKLGDTDPVVANIHERLAELQYMDGDEPSEYFGEPIEAALKRFQRIHHMKETGEADELTQEILFSDKAAMYKLQQGDEGEDVESLQERLQDLGYEVEKTNGYFGVVHYWMEKRRC